MTLVEGLEKVYAELEGYELPDETMLLFLDCIENARRGIRVVQLTQEEMQALLEGDDEEL